MSGKAIHQSAKTKRELMTRESIKESVKSFQVKILDENKEARLMASLVCRLCEIIDHKLILKDWKILLIFSILSRYEQTSPCQDNFFRYRLVLISSF
jgi:hypothetical protein